MERSTLLPLLSIAVFYLCVLGVGLFANKKLERSGSSTDLLLAGRNIPLWIGMLTMTATWVGGGYINGAAEAVFSSGLLWTQAPWGYAIALVLGGLIFAKPMRARGYKTMLDPFTEKYGPAMGVVLFIPALVGEIFWSAAILTALGSTFGFILGLDIETAILISAAIAILYTCLGGLWSVAYTDVLQLACILLGLLLALPFIFQATGGLPAVLEQYANTMGDAASLFPALSEWSGQGSMGASVWLWTDFALLLILGGIPWQVYFQRVLSSRDPQTAARLSYCAAIGCILLAIPPILIGMAGASFDWASIGLAGPESASHILPYVIKHLTPEFVSIIVLGAVAAAVMSSVDSSILSISSMTLCNVYKPIFRPNASERELTVVMRVCIIMVGCGATYMALSVQSIYALWYLCADLVYCILFPQLLLVLFFKRATATGALAGIIVAFLLRLGGGEPTLGIEAWMNYPMTDNEGTTNFPFRTFAMLTNLGVTMLVSHLTFHKPAEDKHIEVPVGA